MEGKSEYEILTSNETAAVAARSTAYLKRLQAAKRLRDHRAAAQEDLQDKELRPWQQQARSALLEYSPLAPSLEGIGSALVSTRTSTLTSMGFAGLQMKRTGKHGDT